MGAELLKELSDALLDPLRDEVRVHVQAVPIHREVLEDDVSCQVLEAWEEVVTHGADRSDYRKAAVQPPELDGIRAMVDVGPLLAALEPDRVHLVSDQAHRPAAAREERFLISSEQEDTECYHA